jgi:ABC-2 type transport system ATP-binding protein
MTAAIETRNLSKWYGNVLGLNDVSLAIEPGITGLLGPNGAGKSTLLKLVTGQMKPSTGSVTIWGEPVRNNYPLYAHLGFCPEQDSFYDEITGWQFLINLLKLYPFSHQEVARRAEKALEFVELLSDKDRIIRAYSRGMRQRLKFAQAIAHDPEVIVLDEPLNGLDPLGKRKVIRLIKEYRSEGKTVVVSSHVLPEIEAMTRNVILIHQGKILAQGDIHYIRELIDTHPHVVSVQCDSARRLASHLAPEEFVVRLHFVSSRSLLIETNNRDKLFSLIPKLVVEEGIVIEEISSPDDNLQAVFDYLVGK